MDEKEYMNYVKALGSQEQEQDGGVYGNQSIASDRADLLDKIKPEQLIIEIRYRLMGFHNVNGTWIKDPNLKDKGISYEGAWEISNLLLPIASQNNSLTDLEEDDVRKRTIEIIKTSIIMCVANYREYGIFNTSQLRYVKEIIHSTTFLTLKQSQNEGIRDLIRNTSKYTSSPNGRVDSDKGNWIKRLMR